MDAPRQIPVHFYTKPGCHLCDDVADALDALSARWPIDVAAIDITRDLDLHRRLWDKIPVVQIGERTLHAPIDPGSLHQAVLAAVEHS